MRTTQLVETYKFWEVAALWAAERLEHDLIVARALARGIVMDGLRFQSVDPRWLRSDALLSGYPYVRYAVRPESPPAILRADTLEHLLAIVRTAEVPARDALEHEFVSRENFQEWLIRTEQRLPAFWFRPN